MISVPTTVTPVNKKHYRHYDENLLDSHILKYAKSGNFFVLKFGTYKESKF